MPNPKLPHRSPWRTFIICLTPLMLLAIGVEIAIVQPVTAGPPDATCISEVKSALIRLLLLTAFQIAPALWLTALRKVPSANLASSLLNLRMPVSTWAAACLLIGWHFWPILKNSSLCR